MQCKLMCLFYLTVPGPPGNLFVNEINSTAIVVSWSEPDVSNGIIILYEILYFVGNVSSLDDDVTSVSVAVTTNTSYRVIIGGLDPFTMYSVAVRAYTSIGAGELTNTFSILTDPFSKKICKHFITSFGTSVCAEFHCPGYTTIILLIFNMLIRVH